MAVFDIVYKYCSSQRIGRFCPTLYQLILVGFSRILYIELDRVRIPVWGFRGKFE